MRKQHWPKRDPIKNYFPLPNEIFSLGLSSTAIAIYGYLLFREDRKTYECLASYRMIGEAIGKSVTTVRKYVAELEDRGLITTEHTSIMTKDGRKWNGCLRYHILPIQMSIDQFTEQQFRRLEAGAARQKVQAKLSRLCEAQEPLLAVGQPTTPPAAERSVSGPCGPVCEVDGFGDLLNGQMNRGVEKSAGESTGAFAAPVRSQPPAVRAVSGRRLTLLRRLTSLIDSDLQKSRGKSRCFKVSHDAITK